MCCQSVAAQRPFNERNHAKRSQLLETLRPVLQSAAPVGSNMEVRGQGNCHAQLAKINNTAHTHCVHTRKFTHTNAPSHTCFSFTPSNTDFAAMGSQIL